MLPNNRFTYPAKKSGAGKNELLSVIILASSAGHRMRSYGPKCLLKDKYGLTLLEHHAQIYTSLFPNCEIICVVGFEADKVIKNKPDNVRIVENENFEETNEVADLRLGLNNAMSSNYLIVFGDMYYSPVLINNMKLKDSQLLYTLEDKLLDDDVGITVVDNEATIMSYGHTSKKWARIAYFAEKDGKNLKTYVNNRENSKKFTFEAINVLLAKKPILAKPIDTEQPIFHIDSMQEYKRILL